MRTSAEERAKLMRVGQEPLGEEDVMRRLVFGLLLAALLAGRYR